MEDKRLIYAVDDEASIRELYSCALSNANFDCECVSEADELFKALSNRIPSLILLDIMLDGINGFQILDKLKSDKRYESIPVIMVSAKGEETSKVKGLNSGADDYISKPFGVMELIARINANIRKSAAKEDDVCEYADLRVDDIKHEITLKGEAVVLTLKEYNLLKLFIQNGTKALKRDEILNAVWGGDYFGETRTLDMHIKQLRKKIAGSSAVIETVRGVGYKLQ